MASASTLVVQFNLSCAQLTALSKQLKPKATKWFTKASQDQGKAHHTGLQDSCWAAFAQGYDQQASLAKKVQEPNLRTDGGKVPAF